MRLHTRHHQKGQSIVETIIILPFFALLIFGIFEMALLLHVKATVNAATFEAARKGSLNHAKPSAMKDGMAGSLAALFLRESPSILKANEAKLKALAALNIPVVPRGEIAIISPSKEVFNTFKKNGFVKEIDYWGNEKEVKKDYLPNDNLMWRDDSYKTVGSGTKAVTVNLQDANILKIRTSWCHKLLVPVLDRFIHWTYTLKSGSIPQLPNAEQLKCDAYAKTLGGGGYYVPVTSSAIVRMQTPIIADVYK